MSGVARMGALTARTAVRSRQVLKTRGDAYWTHKGSTLSPLLLVCLHQSAFGTPRLALYKYTIPPVLYFHGRGEGGGWRVALRAQPQQLRCCTELVRALLRDVAPSAHVLKWALSVQLCWLTVVAQLVRVRARTAGMATRKSENMLAARQLKLPKKRRSLQARTHVLRGDCGGRASTSHSLPKTRCLPSPPSPKHLRSLDEIWQIYLPPPPRSLILLCINPAYQRTIDFATRRIHPFVDTLSAFFAS